MKKLLLVMLFMLLLTGCNSGSDDVETPDGADIATCIADKEYKYIYQDGIVYEFYTDGDLQSDDMLNIVQDAVDTAGSMAAFLTTFASDACVYTTYSAPE